MRLALSAIHPRNLNVTIEREWCEYANGLTTEGEAQTEVGDGAEVKRTEAHLAVIGPRATVGPFSYLRPGTELGAEGKIGAFYETKNVTIGRGSKL